MTVAKWQSACGGRVGAKGVCDNCGLVAME